MAAVKLCFGVKIDAARLAAAIGAHYGEVKYSTCPFCLVQKTTLGNFCSNCGADVRKGLAEIGPSEVVELTLLSRGQPPRPLALVAHGHYVYVCQVLASSDDGLAEASRAPRHYQWDSVEGVIRAYVAQFGITDAEPRIFAMAEEKK
jgi:hypothetical protein